MKGFSKEKTPSLKLSDLPKTVFIFDCQLKDHLGCQPASINVF